MSLSTQEDAGTKFWRMPELVEKLLGYLDEVSILCIVEVKLLNVEVLQAASKGTSKSKLIRMVLGFEPVQTFEQQRTKVQRISKTLLAQLDSPQPLLLQLLHVICAEHKYVKGRWEDSAIRISCPTHTYHSVSPNGFILLEDCEGAVGSMEQRIRKIELMIDYDGRSDLSNSNTLLLALVSRVTRQLVAVETLRWYGPGFGVVPKPKLNVSSKDHAVALNALLQRCDRLLNVGTVHVYGELEMEGWEALAKALQKHPCHAEGIISRKEWMLQARREDLRTIWEAMPGGKNGTPSTWVVEGREKTRRFTKAPAVGLKAERQKGKKAWKELLKFLDEA